MKSLFRNINMNSYMNSCMNFRLRPLACPQVVSLPADTAKARRDSCMPPLPLLPRPEKC